MYKPFLQLVAEDIKTRFGDDLSEIAIVFNNKRPITYLKKHLADTYGKALWSPQFYTVQEFFGLSTSLSEANPLTQFFYLYELHNTLLKEEGAEPETLEEFYPVSETILSDFGQLDYDLVPVDQIYMELFDTTRIDVEFQHFTKEQQDFIRQFWQSFSVAGHIGVQQRFLKLWKRLPKLYRALKEKLRENRQTNPPTTYRRLAEGSAEHPDFVRKFQKVLFVGFNALNRAEAKLFKQWQEEGIALFYFDVDAYYLEDPQQEAGLFVRRNIHQTGLVNVLGESPDIIGKRSSDVHLYATIGKISQTKILHDVLTQHYDEHKTSAILLADESLLVPLLQSLPEVKVNITTGYPLTQSPIFGLLDLWMEVQEIVSHQKRTSIPVQLVEHFLSNPLTRITAVERSRLQKFIHERQLFELGIEDVAVTSSVLPHFFRQLAHPADVIPAMIHMLDLLLLPSSEDSHAKQVNSNLLVASKKILNQLHLGFEKIPQLNITFQIGLIRKAIAPISSAIEGDPLKGIQIMGLLESRCLHFDQVYVLGANEGVLPKTSNSPTFLPNNLRKAYGLPILENQNALSAYLFYRHFQYSEDIHLFYNSIVDESSTGEESRFIKQLEFESGFNFIRHIQKQPIHFPEKMEELVVPKTGNVWEQLYATYLKNGKRFSATALTTYLQSPLLFFLKYVANIKEPPKISQEFEMNRLGVVIHNVMEKIFSPYKGFPDFTPTDVLLVELEKIEALIVEEIGRQYHTVFDRLDDLNSLQRIMHKIASEYVSMYLQYDVDHYRAFRIVELENSEDYTLDFPIEVNGVPEAVKLYGIIDRVDEVITKDGEVKTRIVDYKTGGDSVVYKGLEKVFAPNTENKALIQTLFYSYVFEQICGHTDLEPHLYVARRMREDGTLFKGRSETLWEIRLAEVKEEFTGFLRKTLEEIFDSEIPFRHHPEMKVYNGDPYELFYRNSVVENEE